MTAFELHASQVVPADLDRVWSFFSNPTNLDRDHAGLRWASGCARRDPEMAEGALIEYTVRAGSSVSHCRGEPRSATTIRAARFRDVQLRQRGPYRRWEHTHAFAEVAGGTRVTTSWSTSLPLGPAGSLAHRWVVRSELERIFGHRARAVRRHLRTGGSGCRATHRAGGRGHGVRWQRHSQGTPPAGPPCDRHLVAGGVRPALPPGRHRDPHRRRP